MHEEGATPAEIRRAIERQEFTDIPLR